MKQIDAFIASIFPPDVQPERCPRCGRVPVLMRNGSLSRFECWPWWRDLLGLDACRVGPYVFESCADGEYARRAAAGAWNRSVSAWADS